MSPTGGVVVLLLLLLLPPIALRGSSTTLPPHAAHARSAGATRIASALRLKERFIRLECASSDGLARARAGARHHGLLSVVGESGVDWVPALVASAIAARA